MVDDTLGDAPQKDTSHPTESPAAYDQQPNLQLLAQIEDLVDGPPFPEVGLC